MAKAHRLECKETPENIVSLFLSNEEFEVFVDGLRLAYALVEFTSYHDLVLSEIISGLNEAYGIDHGTLDNISKDYVMELLDRL